MKKIIIYAACVLGACLSLVSCEEDALQKYDVGNRACFWLHSATKSLLGATEAEKKTDTITVTVNIMGYLSDQTRHVDGCAIADAAGTAEEDKLTTAPEGSYEILGADILPGETTGDFKVVVNNLDKYLSGNKTLKLNVGIAENEDFGVGLKENKSIALSWSRALIKPTTWSRMARYFCATYSTMAYKIFVDLFGVTEFSYSESNEAYAMGRKYGDYIRQYNETHSDVLRHDDGDAAGQPIVPIY